MALKWKRVSDDGSSEMTWTLDSLVINAVQYDTGEWVIRYGERTPMTLYSRGVFTREEALQEAQACMLELAKEFIRRSE